MRLSTVLGIALTTALTACSGGAAHVPPTAGPTAPGASSGSYTVSAMMEVYPDGSALACYLMELSLPGDCGSGVPVSQLGNVRLPFSQGAMTRGAYLTPTMKLVGNWNGTSLALTAPATQPAEPASQIKVWSAVKPPSPAQMVDGSTTAAGFRDQQALMADLADLQARGILVMGNGFDEAGLSVLVAAGDQATVDLLHSRYRIQTIYSWLIPTP